MSDALKYVLVGDVERTGNNLVGPRDEDGNTAAGNDIICFAACISDVNTGDIIDSICIYLKPRGKEFLWEEKTLKEFWDKDDTMTALKNQMLAKVKSEGLSIEHGMKKFYDWINLIHAEKVENMFAMFDTAGIDYAFLSLYLNMAGLENMSFIFGGEYRPIIHSSSYHLGVARCLPSDGLWGSGEAALRALGLSGKTIDEKNPYPHDHNPLNDAKSLSFKVTEIYRHVKQKRNLNATKQLNIFF